MSGQGAYEAHFLHKASGTWQSALLVRSGQEVALPINFERSRKASPPGLIQELALLVEVPNYTLKTCGISVLPC